MTPRVITSRYLQTSATVLGGGALLVDSPYFPDELDALAAAAAPGARLFATHSHYDHLMGRLALPDAPLLAGASTVAAVRREPERPARELAEEDARTYVRRARPLHVADIAFAEGLELIDAPGHTGDGSALVWPEDGGVLCCGDYLSDVEIPLLSWAGSLPDYHATLDRLEAVLPRVGLVVPGHGTPTGAGGARRRLAQDRAYLETIPAGDPDRPLPPGRDTPRQREIHRANLERHGGAG
ncbi:MAG TPA: MBL fold metallo-hydrolase [Solirubrobacteraceae bacterium]|nr:MBL fold metallo-hydrolase [Solirubrobacteraceae bacterium]